MATHSVILAWTIPVDRGAWEDTVHRITQSQIQLSEQHIKPLTGFSPVFSPHGLN